MKGYSLVGEGDGHFEVSHPKDGIFKIAKKALSEDMQRRIRSMPQAMATGGMVGRPAPSLPALQAQPQPPQHMAPKPQPAMSMMPSAQPPKPMQPMAMQGSQIGQQGSMVGQPLTGQQGMSLNQGLNMAPNPMAMQNQQAMMAQMAQQNAPIQHFAGGGRVQNPYDLFNPQNPNSVFNPANASFGGAQGLEAEPLNAVAPFTDQTTAAPSVVQDAVPNQAGVSPEATPASPSFMDSLGSVADAFKSTAGGVASDAKQAIAPGGYQDESNKTVENKGISANPNVVDTLGGAKGEGMQLASLPTVAPQDFTKGAKDLQADLAARGQSEAEGLNREARFLEGGQFKMDEAKKKYDASMADNDKQNKDLTAAVLNEKVDPNRLWNNTSTGGKVQAAIGLLLSGFGAGASGQENMAMKAINNAIKADVDSQKDEIGKKENLLAANLRKYGDINQAMAATTMQLTAAVNGQVQATAARAKGKDAIANSKILADQIQQNLDLQSHQLAVAQGQQQLGSALGEGKFANTSVNLEDPRLAPYKDRIVQTPSGGILLAKDPKEAPKVQESLKSLDNLDKQISGMLDMQRDNGLTIPGTTADKLASNAKEAMVLEFGKMADLARFTPEEAKRYEELVPDPGAWRQDRAAAQLMKLREMVRQKRESELANHTEGFRPDLARKDKTEAPRQSATLTSFKGK